MILDIWARTSSTMVGSAAEQSWWRETVTRQQSEYETWSPPFNYCYNDTGRIGVPLSEDVQKLLRKCLTPHRLSKVTWELIHRGATGAQPRERNCGEPTPQYSSKVSTFLTFHDSNPAGHQIAAWIGAHHYALKHCLSDKHCPSKPAVNLPLGHYH